MARLWHTTNIYLHPQIHEYTERLLATLPSHLEVGNHTLLVVTDLRSGY